jgi:hypothetical protein
MTTYHIGTGNSSTNDYNLLNLITDSPKEPLIQEYNEKIGMISSLLLKTKTLIFQVESNQIQSPKLMRRTLLEKLRY